MRTLPDFLKSFAVVTKATVHWGEMDAFKHVNNVSYFRYHETARIAFFQKMFDMLSNEDKVLGLEFMNATGIGPILAETSIKYKFPIKYPETILIGSTIKANNFISKSEVIQSYGVWALDSQRLACEGIGRLIAFDYGKGKKADSFPSCVNNAFMELSKNNSLSLLSEWTKKE